MKVLLTGMFTTFRLQTLLRVPLHSPAGSLLPPVSATRHTTCPRSLELNCLFWFPPPPKKNMNTSGLLRFILSEPDWYMICHTSADIWGFWTLITLTLFGRYRSCRHFQNSCVTARPNEHLWDWFQFVFSYFLKCIPPTHINDDDNLQFVFFLK